MTENEKPAALIVDDDEVFRKRLCRALELRGWEAYSAPGGVEGLALARETAPDLAIVDLKMEGESGLDVVSSIRAFDATISIIMLTGYGSIATALEAVRCGADHYLSKPVDADQILAAYQALKQHGRQRFPHWRGWNGNTSNESSRIAAATSPRLQSCSACIAGLCSENSTSFRPENSGQGRPLGQSQLQGKEDAWLIDTAHTGQRCPRHSPSQPRHLRAVQRPLHSLLPAPHGLSDLFPA
jgi:ActR/RegA family two-component response regulator